jgi:uncharacterized protein (TIGR02001 family)
MRTVRLFGVGWGSFALAGLAWGQSVAPVAASWTVTPAVASQYMFRGVRLAGPSFQPTIQYDRGNGELGAWASFPLQDKVAGQSDPEIDAYGWYKITVSDTVSVQPGFTWYMFLNAEPRNGFYRSTFEPNLAVNWTVSGLTLSPKAYYDVVLRGPTFELNAAYAFPLKTIGSELDFNATVGTYKWDTAIADQAPAVKGWGDYWLASVTLPYQVAANAKVAATVAYTEGSGNYFKPGSLPKFANSAAVGRAVVTISYAVTF